MSTYTASEFIWISKDKCGLGVNHPRTVADATLISTFDRINYTESPCSMIMQTAIINHTRTYTPVNPIFTRNKVDRWTKPNRKTIPNNYIEQVNIATRGRAPLAQLAKNPVLTRRRRFEPCQWQFFIRKKLLWAAFHKRRALTHNPFPEEIKEINRLSPGSR